MITPPGDPAGAVAGEADDAAPVVPASAAAASARGAGRVAPGRWRPAVIAAVLLLAAAQLVVSWFLLSSLNQLRDQTAAANGLQRCLISAQLNQLSATDNAAYRNAVRSCLDR